MTTQALSHEVPMKASKSRIRKWFLRGIITLVAVIVGFMAIGFSFNQIATSQDEQRYPAPGIMVDAGGFNLHLNISGEANGNPTVILEAGNGGFSTQWARIQTALETETRVVSYDRAGLGWSDDSGQPRDVITAAGQLHTALQNAGVEGPYILVGHSLGGLFVRAFADQYPDTVAGVVLVDTAHPDSMSIYPEEVVASQHTLRQFSDIAAKLAPFGIFRITGPLFAEGLGDLPPTQAEQSRAIAVTTEYLQALSAEYHAWFPTMNDQVRQMDDLGDLPLIVISASAFPNEAEAPDGYWDAHFAMQQDLATLSTNGSLRIIEGANHYSLLMNESDSRNVVSAIRDVIAMVKS